MPQRKQQDPQSPRKPRPLWRQSLDIEVIRQLPFWMLAAASLLAAYHAPYGRKAYEFNWDFSWAAIEWSLYKPLHIASCALLMVLGVLAYKWRRWWLAATLTLLVALGWEFAQTTVAGHYARIADLAPDFLGVVLGWLIVEGIRHAMKPEDYLFG